MLKYGRAIRWSNDFMDEVSFCRENGFDFMQVWYYKGSLLLDKVEEPKEVFLKQCGFPVIIHALLDMNEIEEQVPNILKILRYLEHTQVILHPVCKSEAITDQSIRMLADKVGYALRVFHNAGIQLLLENNSKLDPIHYKSEEIEYMFTQNPELELLLDIAHIDSYKHLEVILQIKAPSMLHIADKHFSSIHEHLPIGEGEIDFEYVFNTLLADYNGSVIFEITYDDDQIIQSKNKIEHLRKSFGGAG